MRGLGARPRRTGARLRPALAYDEALELRRPDGLTPADLERIPDLPDYSTQSTVVEFPIAVTPYAQASARTALSQQYRQRTHRTAGSGLWALAQDYYDTYGVWPAFGGRYRGYMSIPGAWRASVMLSDLFASTPWHTYRTLPDGNKVRTPRNAPVLESPAGGVEPAQRVFGSWALDYIWEGNAIGLYTARDNAGRPVRILPIPASVVYVRTIVDRDDPSGLNLGERQYAIGNRVFPASEIFHVKGPCEPGAERGMGVLEMELSNRNGALTLAQELSSQASSIAQAGVPTGTLTAENPEAKKSELAAAKASWLQAQRTRTVAALGPYIKFTAVAWNPEDMQLIEARRFSLAEQELIFGLPVGWLGGNTAPRTYSNIEQDAVNLFKFSVLLGMYTQFEAVFTALIPRGQEALANRDAVLRSDTLTRYQAHKLATGGRAWVTPDEVRGVENMPPLGGDAALLEPAQPAPVSTEDGEES
jgi:phage portal protein BeeE